MDFRRIFTYHPFMDTTPLPTDVKTLQKLVITLRGDLSLLSEKLHYLQNQLFGRKSERLEGPTLLDQLNLFEALEPGDQAEDGPKTKVGSHIRKKPKRSPIPEKYPRVDIVHDVSEEQKICHCGCMKACIGEDVSEEVDIKPAVVRVLRHIRPKYACSSCQNVAEIGPTVAIAPLWSILPKCMASYRLLAYLVVSKFVDSMPLYRMERKFKRYDLQISRKTMSDWMVKLGEKLKVLWQLHLEEIRGAPWLGMDETPLQVHREPGRANTSKSYMWVMQCRQPKPMVIFHYSPGRSASVARELLGDYMGPVVTDDCKSYHWIDHRIKDGVCIGLHCLCWMHTRQKFQKVIQKPSTRPKPGTITAEALDVIRSLYALERHADDHNFSLDQRLQMRQEQTRPLLLEFKVKLEEVVATRTPTGYLGEAINYTLRNWNKLLVFLENPLIDPDNKWSENSIRPMVVGRKNWLFAGSPAGAQASAILYSFAITAKLNGIDEFQYFCYLFKNFPKATTQEELKALLPIHMGLKNELAAKPFSS